MILNAALSEVALDANGVGDVEYVAYRLNSRDNVGAFDLALSFMHDPSWLRSTNTGRHVEHGVC